MSRAPILTAVGKPLEVVDDFEPGEPTAGEVLVRMVAAGVCHSDLSFINGSMRAPTPCVPGHEGAGYVEAVGPGVTGVSTGDPVVLSWVPQCGECFFCARGEPHLCERGYGTSNSGVLLDGTTRASRGGEAVYQLMGLGAFAERVVVPACAVVPVASDVDLSTAALLGCAVLTGAGAAMNTAAVQPGESVVVIGCGGVGLNAVQGARIAGAETIIAVDPVAAKRDLAETLGATVTIDAADDVVALVRELTDGRGADVVLEVAGLPATIGTALRLGRRGGRVVLVGIPPNDTKIDLAPGPHVIFPARALIGSYYGSADIRRDIPRFIELQRSGDLLLDPLVSRRIPLDLVNEALDVLQTGESARWVIEF